MGAILTDEIGIEFALLGKFRARARYRPIYRLADHLLRPVAVHGEMAIMRDGAEVALQAMLGNDPSPAARQAMALLALTLVVRNHRRSDADALDLHLDFPAGPSRDISLEALEELAAPNIDAQCITVFVDGAEDVHAGTCHQLKASGYRLGLVARLEDPALADAIAMAKPHILRIEDNWLEKAAGSTALANLLGRFVASCHDAGTDVLFQNIDDRSRLATALELNADAFAGDALGPSLSAGSAMDLTALPVAGLTAQTPNVLPFARRWRH